LAYDLVLSRALSVIGRISEVEIQDYEDEGEWFRLHSKAYPDSSLFEILKKNWNMIVGIDGESFALIYCKMGSHPGVWLHYLEEADEPEDFLEGCHSVVTW
jgi:hypothetical protein